MYVVCLAYVCVCVKEADGAHTFFELHPWCACRVEQRGLHCSDVLRMFRQCVLGGATACSAGTRAAVRTEVCVILLKGAASVDWAGPDRTATQVHIHRKKWHPTLLSHIKNLTSGYICKRNTPDLLNDTRSVCAIRAAGDIPKRLHMPPCRGQTYYLDSCMCPI